MAETATFESGREEAIHDFLARVGWAGTSPLPLADDCSFRRYFRLVRNGERVVLMDAPPDLEDVRPFVIVARRLAAMGYSAPEILAEDPERGFLLVEDFGDATYTRALANGADEAQLYRLAFDVLIDLHDRQIGEVVGEVPEYGEDKLLSEAAMFVDWYLRPGLELEISDAARSDYIEAWRACLPLLRGAPETLVLRDYHVDNLIVLEGRDGHRACGLLDFQDAVIGPASYDLVSLLQDSRRDIPEAIVQPLLAAYLDRFESKSNQDAFLRSYLAFGAQRALKVFGIFTRQSVLYGNHQYLTHIPRLWRHTMADLSIPELAAVREWIETHVPEDRRLTPNPGGEVS